MQIRCKNCTYVLFIFKVISMFLPSPVIQLVKKSNQVFPCILQGLIKQFIKFGQR